jgi:hypothetical protein
MATYQIDWHWFTAYGDAPNTIDINLPPAWIGAHVAYMGILGREHGSEKSAFDRNFYFLF